MQIELTDSLEGVDALREEWNELFDRVQPGPFIRHSWVANSYRHMPPDEILVLAAYNAERQLIGVFPFAIQPFRIKRMTFKALVHGVSAITDYSMFLADTNSNRRLMVKRVLEKLQEMQADRWDFVKIDNLSDADALSKLFISLSDSYLYGRAVPGEITPAVDLTRPYIEAKKASNIKRRFRKLGKSSELVHFTGGDIRPELMQRFCELHRQSFPDGGFGRPESQAFFSALIADPVFSENIKLSLLLAGDDLVAGHFGFVDKDCFYYYVPTFDRRFSDAGPGQHLLSQLIEAENKAGCHKVDLMRGSESYKFDWTNEIHTNYTLFGFFGEASWFRRMLTNAWILTKSLPMFR